MNTIKEVSRITGVSPRTLHYYDSIGLLKPARVTESGYRLYDEASLERLQHILLFKELRFPLKKIKQILDSPDFDRNLALEHLENLIDMTRGIRMTGVKNLDFSAFDAKKIDEYAAQAKTAWGKSAAYREYEEKMKNRSEEDCTSINQSFMELFSEFGRLNALSILPDSDETQSLVEQLMQFITENFYSCTPELLQSLGKMYGGGGGFTESIDKKGGRGTADFTSKAIDIYADKHSCG